MRPRAHYDALADLFDYPESDYPVRVRRALEVVAGRCEPAARALEAFAEALPGDGDAFGPGERDARGVGFARNQERPGMDPGDDPTAILDQTRVGRDVSIERRRRGQCAGDVAGVQPRQGEP